MAGNPFRRSMAMNPPTSDAPTTPQAQKQRTKTKRVKIVSPPDAIHDTTELHGHEHGGRRLSASDSATRAPSPPPPRQSNDDDDDEALSDSTATADSDLDQATANARRNSGSLPPPAAGTAAAAGSMAGGMKAPYNPFARTLATSEASFGLQHQQDAYGTAQQDAQRPRPAMDVDAFKNILLTGSATPPASNTGTSSPAARRPHDSSSSTDTSSIFDPSYTLHPESPRVDHYDFESDSDDGDDNDDQNENETERSNLMGQGRLDDLAPPAPPKPKSTRGPQTVSFADFDQSIPPNFTAPGGRGTPPLNNTQQKGILRPTIQRSISDLNKPLPPPPEARKLSDTAPPPVVPDKDVPQIQQPVSALPPTPDEDSTQKKVPPPPPASRRQAALPTRPRSASNLSTQESISDIPDPETFSATPPQLKAEESSSNKLSQPPPPPPARKVHPVVPSPAPADAPSHPPTEAKPLVPPPPPRRHPSKTGSMRTASPANSLRKDVSSPPPSSGGNAAAAPPPPPPPPRRAAGGGNSSQRSSIDGRPSSLRRFGGMENQRRASRQSVESAVSDEKGVAASPISSSPGTEAAKRDVLADMMDFQKEIDALRARQGTVGGGGGGEVVDSPK